MENWVQLPILAIEDGGIPLNNAVVEDEERKSRAVREGSTKWTAIFPHRAIVSVLAAL